MNDRKFEKAERMQKVSLSVILRLSEQAQEMKRQGHTIINLCVGEPDFNTPEHIKHAAQQAIINNETSYTAIAGTPALRSAICKKFSNDLNVEVKPQQVMVSNGAKQVLFNAFFASLSQGDEVLVPAPYWTSYIDIISVCGGSSKIINCNESTGFKITASMLKASITPNTRWLLLNSPSNPTGAVYTPNELREIIEVLLRFPHVWVMVDEIYEHLVYSEEKFQSFLKIAPELASRTLIINGVSKAYAMTGWRVGYAVAPKELITAMIEVQSQSTSGVCSIAQAAATRALTGPQDILQERLQSFRQRRDAVVNNINDITGLKCSFPEGAFYVFVDCSELIGMTTPDNKIINTSFDFCQYLLEAAGVAVVPGSAFGIGKFFRLSYATSLSELEQACKKINIACDAIKRTTTV